MKQRPGSSCLIPDSTPAESQPIFQGPLAYLLVVPNQNEVLASFAQGGNGVGLKDFSSLFQDDDPRLHLLQDLAIFGSTSREQREFSEQMYWTHCATGFLDW